MWRNLVRSVVNFIETYLVASGSNSFAVCKIYGHVEFQCHCLCAVVECGMLVQEFEPMAVRAQRRALVGNQSHYCAVSILAVAQKMEYCLFHGNLYQLVRNIAQASVEILKNNALHRMIYTHQL